MITPVCGLVRGNFPTQRPQRGNNHSRRLAGMEGGSQAGRESSRAASKQGVRQRSRQAFPSSASGAAWLCLRCATQAPSVCLRALPSMMQPS